MGFDLTNERIQDTYQQILQISGSTIVDGTGSVAPVSLTSASYADFAVTASYALNGGGGGSVDTGSLVSNTTFNAYTSSNDAKVDSLIAATSSYLTSADISGKLDTSVFNTYTSSNDASVSAKLETSTFNSYTSSNDSKVDSLIAATSSYLTEIPSGTVSSSAQTIANISGSVITPSTVVTSDISAGTFTVLGQLAAQDTVTTTLTASNGLISGDLVVNGTASFSYLKAITGSAKIIGDEFIVLNADTPAARYAGMQVYDSGSAATASIEWDGLNDVWMQVEQDGNTAVLMTGPTGSKGSETFPTANTILKAHGDHQVVDSIITDDGSEVAIAGNLDINGGGRLTFTDGEVRIGRNANASGSFYDGIAIGDDANAESTSLSIGSSTLASGSGHVVIGRSTITLGGYSAVVVGSYSDGPSKSVVVGASNRPTAEEAIQIGYDVTDVTTTGGINIGDIFKYDGTSEITLEGNITTSGSIVVSGSGITFSDGTTQTTAAGAAGLVSGTGTDSIRSSDDLTTTPANASATYAIAIGNDTVASDNHTIAIGGSAAATQDQAIAIGRSANAIAQDSIAIGRSSYIQGGNAIGLGEGTRASQLDSIAIGTDANVSAQDGIAIGHDAESSDANTIAIGIGANSSVEEGITIGSNTNVDAGAGVAIGQSANASGGAAVAIGRETRANGGSGVAIGKYADALANRSIAIGENAEATDNYAIAIGHNSQGKYDYAIGIGASSWPWSNYSIALGYSTEAKGVGSVAIGNNVGTANATNAINIANTIKHDGSTIDLLANVEVSGQLYSPTFAGSVASSTSSIDFDNGNFATLSLSADTFLANPSNLKSGTTYTLIITSGSQVSNYGTSWKFAEGTAPTLSDGTDILTCVSDGTNLYATALANFS
jgi:hypothetical protein